MGVHVPRTSGMTRHHLVICSHLWTSSYYQKRQHFRSCATSALILCSFLHVGAISRRASCISRAVYVLGSHGRTPGPHGSSPHPSAASEQVADWKARLFLHGLDRSSVHHVVLSNWTCWLSGGISGSVQRPPPEIMFLDVTVCADCTVPFIVPNTPIRSCSLCSDG